MGFPINIEQNCNGLSHTHCTKFAALCYRPHYHTTGLGVRDRVSGWIGRGKLRDGSLWLVIVLFDSVWRRMTSSDVIMTRSLYDAIAWSRRDSGVGGSVWLCLFVRPRYISSILESLRLQVESPVLGTSISSHLVYVVGCRPSNVGILHRKV